MTKTTEAELAAILDDPATSDWLRTSLFTALQRDPCDAVNDAETLSSLLSKRFDKAAAGAAG